MGFKYKKFEIRTGEVIEPNRIRENMQTLAHEINGSLDRENLPEGGITSDMIKAETFNDIAFENVVSSTGTSLGNQDNRFEELMTKELDVPVDCVVIAHFGAYWAWHATQFASGNYAIDTVSGLSGLGQDFEVNHKFDKGYYFEAQNHFIDYRLKINGETVSNAPRYPFMRQNQSTYLTGSLQCVAGKIKVSVDVRVLRNDKGTREASEGFFVRVHDRNLVIQVKKR